MSLDVPQDDPEYHATFRMDPEQIPIDMLMIIQNVSAQWPDQIFTFEMAYGAMGVKQTDPDFEDYALAFSQLVREGLIRVHSQKNGKTYFKLSEN